MLLCLFFTSHLHATWETELNQNNDHGFWSEENLDKKFWKNWIARFHFEQRWGADYKKFWYEENQFILLYDLSSLFCLSKEGVFTSLNIGPGYTHITTTQKNTHGNFHWVGLERPLLEANLGMKLFGWTINQRMRGEYNFYTRKHYKAHGAYRHRLLCLSPWKWSCYKINPYVSNEWFFRQNTYSTNHPHGLVGGWHENRFRVGLIGNLYKETVTLALFWQWRILKQKPESHPRWFNTYQEGVALNFIF